MCSPSIFYRFSGCDTVSSFYSKGKCKGWDIWIQNRSDFDEIFIRLENRPSDVTEADMNAIESFVMKMYTKLSKISLTDLRIDMFKSLTDNDLRKLPPSRRALGQHTRRACYQAGYVWQESVGDLTLPNPENWDGYLKKHISATMTTGKVSDNNRKFNFNMLMSYKGTCKNCKCGKSRLACISMYGCNRKCL